jgi:hypothetical protein
VAMAIVIVATQVIGVTGERAYPSGFMRILRRPSRQGPSPGGQSQRPRREHRGLRSLPAQ